MPAYEEPKGAQMHYWTQPTRNVYIHPSEKSDSIQTENSKFLSLTNHRLTQRTGADDKKTHQRIKRHIQKWPKRGLIQMSRSLNKHENHEDTKLLRTTLVLQRLERKIPQEMLQPHQRRHTKLDRAFSAKLANKAACSDVQS